MLCRAGVAQQPGSAAHPAEPHSNGGAVATQLRDVELTESERKLQHLRGMLSQLREAIRETEVMLERAERSRSAR